MKRLNKVAVFLVGITLLLGINTVSAATYTIMTEEYPPYNYTEDGKITGLGTEVVEEIAKRVGHPTDIEMQTWARAYGLIQKKPGIILYVMTRTEAREDLFEWVGPVASNKWVFFAKKGSNLSISSLEDAKKVGKIGTYKDDAGESFLKEKGFTNLDSVLKDVQNIPKLVAGRIDLWINGEFQGIYKAKQQGVGDQIEQIFEIKDAQLYIAFSKGSPQEDVAKWQAALDAMKTDGTYDAILKKYK